jgi:hypothetical protein
MSPKAPRKQPTASMLARAFASKFLAEGNFVDAGGPMSLKPSPAAARAILDTESTGFVGLSVQAVGYAEGPIANAKRNEDQQAEDEVHIYVTRGSKKELRALPKSVGGIRVLVHNTGKVSVRPRAASSASNRGMLYEHDGRIACGSSCAPSGKNYAGTLGALVKRKGHAGLFALSNNHVFADCNHTPTGMPILSPAGMDGRPAPARPPGRICEHFGIVELRSGSPAFVNRSQADLAIASVPDEDVVSSWQGDDSEGYDTPEATRIPQRRLKVKKFGRTTGLTHGIIESRLIELDIPYQSENFSALVWFEGVWSVTSVDSEPFALGGDSGSLVVTEDDENVVGMVFAIAPKGMTAYIIPVDCLESAFDGLSFVGDHGV